MFVHAGMTLVVSGDGRYFSKDAIQVHSCPFSCIFFFFLFLWFWTSNFISLIFSTLFEAMICILCY